MFNGKFLKSASYLVGSSLVLSLTQSFSAVAYAPVNPGPDIGISHADNRYEEEKEVVNTVPDSSNETSALYKLEINPGDLYICAKSGNVVEVDSYSAVEALLWFDSTLETGDLVITKSGIIQRVLSRAFAERVDPMEAKNFLERFVSNLDIVTKMRLFKGLSRYRSCRVEEHDNSVSALDICYLLTVLLLLDILQSLARESWIKGPTRNAEDPIGVITDRSFVINVLRGALKGIKQAWSGNAEKEEEPHTNQMRGVNQGKTRIVEVIERTVIVEQIIESSANNNN